MKMKFALAAITATAITAAAPVTTAGAAYGPCYSQQQLFDKYNIELNMDAPLVSYAYNTACKITG